MSPDMGEIPLLGRLDEREALRDALREVVRGANVAAFVTGDSGVGKTRLLLDAGAHMRDAGAVVLAGACLDIGDAAPLHPLRQALRQFQRDPGQAGRTAQRAAEELLALLDGEVTGPDGAGPLLEGVARGLRAIADWRPLVLIVDDLQWADESIRQLLVYLHGGLADLRLLLLGGVCTERVPATSSLRQTLLDLRRLPSARIIDLPPLDRTLTGQLAAAVAGRDLSPDDAEVVWERSEGNPFVVVEVARDLRDGRAGPSDTLRQMVQSQVDSLPAEARTVLHAVAAGVEPVDHRLLGRVVTLDEEPLIEAVRAAVRARLLAGGPDGYRLAHRLIREVLEPGLLPAEVTLFNRRYAGALADDPHTARQHPRLARHWRLAGEWQLAFAATRAAAEEAERLCAYTEALEHWTSATGLVAEARSGQLSDVDVVALGLRAAEAAHRSGEHERALAMLDRLAVQADGTLRGSARTSRARYLAAAGLHADAECEYEWALADPLTTAAERAQAAAHFAELLQHLGRYAEAEVRARQALGLIQDDRAAVSTLVLASATLGFSQAYLDDPVAGQQSIEHALRTAEEAGTPTDVAEAYLHLAELLSGPLNELEEGVRVAREGAARVERLGLGRTFGTRLSASAANGLFRLGDWPEAERVTDAALRHNPAGADAAELLLARCRIRMARGDLDGAEQDLDGSDALLIRAGARHVLPLLTLRAGLAMWRGRHDEARGAVQEGLAPEVAGADDIWRLAPLVWHGLRAEAEAWSSGTGEPDQEAIRRLQQVAEQIWKAGSDAPPAVRGTVAGYQELCAGELGRVDNRPDPAAWARAAEIWEHALHPYPATYARLRQAEALFAQRTRNAEGTDVLRDAYRRAVGLGAGPLAEEIQTVARRARVQLRPGGSDAPGAARAGGARIPAARVPSDAPAPGAVPSGGDLTMLTARELQVLEGVAAGRTNREIANNLFISERTVGVHVSHILDKLQVRSRVQATMIFERTRMNRGG